MGEAEQSQVESPLEQRHVQWTLLASAALSLVMIVAAGAVKWRSTFPTPRRDAGHSSHAIQIDINAAPAHELALLPGVGPVLAERIVDDRMRRGDFISVEDLRRVYGIGPKKLDEISDLCVVDVAVEGTSPHTR